MPKKSRKLKIRASLRKTAGLTQPTYQSKPSITQEIKQNIPLQKPKTLVSVALTDVEKQTASYFRSDLTKSVVFIAGIITLEIILYFVSMSTNFRSILKF